MLYKFNQSKSFQKKERMYALLSHFLLSLVITVFMYAFSNIIFVNIFDLNIDVIEFKYVMIFLFIFIVIYTFLVIYYFRLEKGVKITNNKINYYIGYCSKFIPVKLIGFIGYINICDIEKCELLNSFDFSKLKFWKDNNAYIYMGCMSKNIPVVRLTVKNKDSQIYYFLPLEKNEDFIVNLKEVLK